MYLLICICFASRHIGYVYNILYIICLCFVFVRKCRASCFCFPIFFTNFSIYIICSLYTFVLSRCYFTYQLMNNTFHAFGCTNGLFGVESSDALFCSNYLCGLMTFYFAGRSSEDCIDVLENFRVY